MSIIAPRSFRARETVDAVWVQEDNIAEAMDWCGGEPGRDPGKVIAFKAWTGTWQLAAIGDWIVREENGNFRVIVSREFDKRYEVLA